MFVSKQLYTLLYKIYLIRALSFIGDLRFIVSMCKVVVVGSGAWWQLAGDIHASQGTFSNVCELLYFLTCNHVFSYFYTLGPR